MEQTLQFFSEEIEFTLDKEDSVRNWILFVIDRHGKKAGEISYIFCSDEYLLALNKEHLKHDYYTDILTFAYAPADAPELHSDIYISIDRVKDNADSLKISVEDELHRVLIHGVLHLLGFDDQGEGAQEDMRMRENEALAQRDFIQD